MATNCLICGAVKEPFLSFGPMPCGNGFLSASDFKTEFFFDLTAAFCPRCSMVQLMEQPDRNKMFHSSYPFFSGSSRHMAKHFSDLAVRLIQDLKLTPSSFVVEIGSNDGTLLESFAKMNIPHLGIEPAENVVRAAQSRGIRTLSAFFDQSLAQKIVSESGPADLFLAANVMCHIPDLHSILEGIRLLLKPGGMAVFEDPYWGEVLQKTSYDQIYDEHVFLFSLTSLRPLFLSHGLELIDIEKIWTHGGSIRYYVTHQGRQLPASSVSALLESERTQGISKFETYERFRSQCEKSRDDLRRYLQNLKAQGARIMGYGATSKSTTVTHYCGLTRDWVESICDTTPEKQGKFSPGKHIPVVSWDSFRKHFPDYALLFAWNHREEIMAKENAFRDSGGKWISYVPKVEITP